MPQANTISVSAIHLGISTDMAFGLRELMEVIHETLYDHQNEDKGEPALVIDRAKHLAYIGKLVADELVTQIGERTLQEAGNE